MVISIRILLLRLVCSIHYYSFFNYSNSSTLKEGECDISSGSSDESLSINTGHQKKCQTKRQSIDSDDEADISGPRRENSIMLAKTKNRNFILLTMFYPYSFDQL
jgi:hypothetical protein